MPGTTKRGPPLPMHWPLCASTTGGKWVFVYPAVRTRWENCPQLCASPLSMRCAVRANGQSRAQDMLNLLVLSPRCFCIILVFSLSCVLPAQDRNVQSWSGTLSNEAGDAISDATVQVS